ncbi:MAG: hypothetical protein ACO1OF_20365 [Adhaeribacter sp.]
MIYYFIPQSLAFLLSSSFLYLRKTRKNYSLFERTALFPFGSAKVKTILSFAKIIERLFKLFFLLSTLLLTRKKTSRFLLNLGGQSYQLFCLLPKYFGLFFKLLAGPAVLHPSSG